MVTTKKVLSLLVMLTSAFGMVSCDSTPDGSVFAPLGNHSVVLVQGSGQSASRGQLLPNPIIAKVVDASGNPVPNQYVFASVVSGGGTLNVPIPMSDVNGDVFVLWTLGTALTADILNISVSNSSGTWDSSTSVNVTATRIGSPASIANSSIVGTGPIIANGVTTSHITVTLLDSNHEPLTGIVPTFSATGTNNYFPCTAVNTLGVSTCTMSSSTPGLKTLSLLTPITMTSGTVQFNPGAPSLLTASGDTNNLLSVLLKDAYSNVIPNQQIDWTVTAGGGTLTGPSSSTDVTGTASNIYTSASSGVQTITAGVHGYPQIALVTFTLDIGTWTFQQGTTGSFILGNNIDFSASNVCELTSFNAPDNSAASFAAGTAIGVTYGTLSDGVTTGFKLGYDGTNCDGSVAACDPGVALNSTWTPHWNNLTALWHFDDAPGSPNAVDSSSSGISSGVVSGGVTFGSAGKISSAVNFDGSSGQIAIADNASVGVNGNMTLSAWVKYTNGIQIAWKNQHYSFCLNGGHIQFATSNNWNYNAQAGSGLNDGKWHHVVTVVTSGVGYQFYIDGANVGSYSTSAILADNGSALYIGSTGGGGYTAGSLDEFAIWNVALSASDIQTIYARQSVTHSGVFTSRVMDAKQSSSWTSLSWLPTLPFGKALPDNAVNETIANYPLLTNSTLMNGIAGLWHFDEPAGTTGAGSVIDRSGNGNNGTPTNGTVVFGNAGKLGGSATFDGAGEYISVPDSSTIDFAGAITMAAWVYPNNFNNYQCIICSDSTSYSRNYAMMLTNGNPNSVFVSFQNSASNGINNAVGISTAVTANAWNHIVVTSVGTSLTVYLNGFPVGTWNNPGFAGISAGSTLHIGSEGGGNNFNGSLDEVGVWNRALSATEVQQLYQRGASRVKLQVQSCAQPDCSDGTWQGPDGTSTSYYSEFDNTSTYNRTTNNPSGTVNAGLPSMTFANFATPTPSPNRYFQYRAIFESDASDTTLMPEVKSIAVGPNHYDFTSPSIVGKTGVTVPVLTAFTQTLGSNGCTSATYNLGIGSSVASAIWYYWNGSTWSVAGGTTSTSSAATAISTNLASFPVIGSDTVYFKAFLNSNGSTPCELSALQLNGHN
jgi:hypothetical protein